MVGADLINAGDFDRITALSREALRGMLGFQVVHLGINAGESGAAAKGAGIFETLFGFAPKDGASSVFAGEGIEIMKQAGAPGTHGHIALATNSVYRAVAFLERKGVAFNRDSVKTDAGGNMTVIYLRDEILGFAAHLVQRK
jgi:2-dehydro-3-deoxyphosphogluconate aldolase/(4S)-4-hydroxy-2-oxoglutarate aldolase